MMTAHILVPAIDEQKPATLSSSIVDGMLRGELGFQGVILSDDLEMKAIADTYTVPEAAVQAIAAGCDGVLVCRHLSSERSQDAEVQAAVLEALVHAVEDGRIPYTRAEDALSRNRRTKERFLAAPVAPGRGTALREVLGNDTHRRIADEMARFL
jgi:beta-N-acetylhexosaminidase